MSERLKQLNGEIAFWQQRKTLASEQLVEASEMLLTLGSERNSLIGSVATRHLYLVPNTIELRSVPDGAA